MKKIKKKKIKRSTLKHKADKLFSLVVRGIGVCEAAGLDKIKCGGVLQCCHIITRGRLNIRYEFRNAICCCQGHHVFYTYHPIKWEQFVEKNFPDKYAFVKAHENETNPSVDYEGIMRFLEEVLSNRATHSVIKIVD